MIPETAPLKESRPGLDNYENKIATHECHGEIQFTANPLHKQQNRYPITARENRLTRIAGAIQHFRAAVAELRRELDHYGSGWRIGERRGDGAWIDVTEKHLDFLTRSIAEYERVTAILERQIREG